LAVTYDLTAEDILAYWKYLYRHSPPFRAQYWLGYVLAPMGGAWLATDYGRNLPQQVAIFVAAAGAIALLYAFLFGLFLRAVVGSLAKKAGGRGVGRHTLTVDPDGVRELGPAAEHAHRWSAVQSLQEGPDHFFLLVGFGTAYVVPKRSFQAPEDLQEFRETIGGYRSGGPTTR
jgi:hypothetical protein